MDQLFMFFHCNELWLKFGKETKGNKHVNKNWNPEEDRCVVETNDVDKNFGEENEVPHENDERCTDAERWS